MKTDLITREGYDMLYKELNYLWKERRPEITEKVVWAASLGDRSENADYCQRQDYWPFFAIFNVRYCSLMLPAFRHFIITDWRGVFCQHSGFAFFL